MKKFTCLSILFVTLLSVATASQAQYEPGTIFTAARRGDLLKVKELLQQQYDQNILDVALGSAVVGNQTEIIEFLHNMGANINHISSYNTRLINNAIMYGHFDAAKKLIELDVQLDKQGYGKVENNILIKWYWTPLMCAAYKGNLDLVRMILEKDVDVNTYGWSSSPEELETAADIAAYSGHLTVLKLLLKYKTPINEEIIYKVARGGHIDIIDFLLKHQRFDINSLSLEKGHSLLMEASWWGHFDLVEHLVKKGADLNLIGRNNTTALKEARSNIFEESSNQKKIIGFLIRMGAKE